MGALKGFANSLSNSVSSTVFSTYSAVKDVLPGNPVTREFEVGDHVASAGPGLIWKVFSGHKKSTKQAAAVFVLEKRILDRFERAERDHLLDVFRKAVSQLTRLRHPQILTVQHPLEESRDCLAFATEPIFCSLANVLGRTENMPSPVPPHIRDYKMFDVEIKYGLMQLSEGLAFLHDSVKLLHRNISPESIIVNHQGAWKIFGFDFCIPNMAPANQPPVWPFPEYNHGTSVEFGYPDMDFLAPEYALSGECKPSADMFSVGMIAFTLYNTKPLFCNSGNWGVYKKNAQELRSLRESNLQLIPPDLKEYLKLLLNATPELRPDAAQFAKIGFFDDIGVKTLNNLDSQFQWDNLQKSQFYKGLPTIIPKLPHRVALHRVVPCLSKEFVNPPMVPFVLPGVLQIAEEASKPDFEAYILPDLKRVMRLTEPVQILLIFMQRMELLLAKTPPTDVKNDVLPMIYRALESDASQIQELCLSIIPGFAGLLDYQAMKNALLPRIKKLCIATTLLSVRVNCLICIGKLLTNLDKWLVIDEILPMMQQIPSREPAVIMGITGVYKLAFTDDKLGLTKEVIASKVLPFLFPLSIENGLTLPQYNVIMTLIRQMIAKVEEEHSAKLEQLTSLQNEQRSALQISMSENTQVRPDQLIANPSASTSAMDDMFSGLGLGSYVQKKDTGAIATGLMSSYSPDMSQTQGQPSQNKVMSLEEKRRLAQQSESIKKLNHQPQLSPAPASSMAPRMSSSGMGGKDLTSSLMERNLSQMKSSQSLSSFPSSTPNYGQMSSSNSTMMSDWSKPRPSQPTKPDLSAFDSLLTPMNSGQKQSMNSMLSPMGMSSGMNSRPGMVGVSSNQGVKPLSANDISDLLS